jgi:long-subunit acyl-CoA synthetase (AMP-forming)
MDLRALKSKLRTNRGSVQTLAGGKVVERPYRDLARDIDTAVSNLRQWGVAAGMRVGIYAQNSYE